ncbi:MAG: hypothetical protein AB9903_20380 [Vulcanimicrobiota bacterium]
MMKTIRIITGAALLLLLLGLGIFYLLRGHLPFTRHIRTRSTIAKYPVTTVPQKINRKEGGPDLPAGMRALFLIKLSFKIEGLPPSAVKSPDSDGSSGTEGACRVKDLTVEAVIGAERIARNSAELSEDRQFTCETIVSQNLFDNTDIVKSLTINYPGYRPFVKNDIPLKKLDEETKEAVIDRILLRKE